MKSLDDDWYRQITAYLPDPTSFEFFSLFWKNEKFKKTKSISIQNIYRENRMIWKLWEDAHEVMSVEQEYPDKKEAKHIARIVLSWYKGLKEKSDLELEHEDYFEKSKRSRERATG